MPTSSMVKAMALSREISAAINFLPERQRGDAQKLMRYASAIGNTTPNVLMVIMVMFIPISMLIEYASLPLTILFGICITVAICFYAFRTRRRLVREINTIVNSNPSYWKPIQAVLEAAILRVDGTRIVRK